MGGGCHIYPRGHTYETRDLPDIRCRSEEEFNDLALKYFGTTPPAVLSGSKILAVPPHGENATLEQAWEDMQYCYQNPSASLQSSDGTVYDCRGVNDVTETRVKECTLGPKSKTKDCKRALQNIKDIKAGRPYN